MTFTNKASGEMKSRIIESLFQLAKADEKASVLAASILKGKEYEVEKIFKKASNILNTILNDYSAFHVGTIDRFFQWVIRSFARESGLQAGYNLELNNRRILVEAIDLLMYSLDSNEKLKDWLIKYASDKISEGKDWNFQKDLYNLGNEIFREEYQEITGGIKTAREQKEGIEEYRHILSKDVTIFENYMAAIGAEALSHIQAAGLSIDDFSYKYAGVAGYFHNISTKKDFDPKTRAREALNQAEKWVTAGCKNKNQALSLVQSHLNTLLEKALGWYDEKIIPYNTAKTILRNLYAYAILTDIYLMVREITNEKNLFLLSDATVFLRRIIANNDAPFIYEKAGNYFKHFMLDEFQDTSRYQWNNFQPLIANGLATGNESLIVGDVKQAIYRWRNSDWKILATEVEKSFPFFNVKIQPLDTNWRSNKNIIAFNNSLFSASSVILQEKMSYEADKVMPNKAFFDGWKNIIGDIYENSMQKIAPGNLDSKGYIEVSFHELEKSPYMDMLTEQLPKIIHSVLKRGYKQGDIAILVRKGKQGRDIAGILMNYKGENNVDEKFTIISNDSLYIENHPTVRFLVALLKYLRNPSELINTAFIRHEYIQYLAASDTPPGYADTLFAHCEKGIIQGLHPGFDEFAERVGSLKRLPLFELTEEMIRLFRLSENKDNIAFVQAFQDLVLDFVRDQTADISSFLKWWELHGSNQTLTISESQDAIRIMTIHKAKGLEFPVVLIPFCDWNMDAENLKDYYIWCKNNQPPFNLVENVPVHYTSMLTNTLFQFDYLDEKFRNYADNLNLLYVALTRAENELYVIANLSGHKETAAKVIHEIVSTENQLDIKNSAYPLLHLPDFFNQSENLLIAGEKGVAKPGEVKAMPEFLTEYTVSQSRERLRLNIKNAWLISNETDYHKKIGYGTIMHEILSGIETMADIETSVRRAVIRGKIPACDYDDAVLFLTKAISSALADEWFNGSWKLMREREINAHGNNIYRPDRVMIKDNKAIVVDYKFGQDISPKHTQQVKIYCDTIKDIDNMEVKGYVWYLYLNKVSEVL